MKNLIQKITLSGMVGLVSLVSGCSISRVEESKVMDTQRGCRNGLNTFTVTTQKKKNTYLMGLTLTNSEPQGGLVEYEYLCDPEVEWSNGEIKIKYILKETRKGTTYHSVELVDGGCGENGSVTDFEFYINQVINGTYVKK